MELNQANIKRLMKKESVKTFAVTSLIAIVFLLLRRNTFIFRNISDFFCMQGLMHIVIGASRYIRNVGLFKSFSYLSYRHKWKKIGALNGETHPMSLAEYTQNIIMDETKQKSVKCPMIIGLISFLISYALIFAC